MKFIRINPAFAKVGIIEAPSFDEALPMAGLSPGQIDFGSISANLGIVVFEYGLYEDNISYFAYRQTLYAGSALIFRTESGDTVDVLDSDLRDVSSFLSWLPTRPDAEKAIRNGFIYRPQQAVNGEVLWQWGK